MTSFKLNTFLPYRIAILSQSISRLIAQEYESRFGLNMNEWRVIAIIAEHKTVTAQDIATYTLMDKMTVSRVLRRLRNRQLINRSPSMTDARKQLVGLSQTGTEIYKEIIPLACEYEAALKSALNQKDINSLHHLIKTLQAQADNLKLTQLSGSE